MSKALATAKAMHKAGFLPIPISEGCKVLVAWEGLKAGYTGEQLEQMPWNGGLGVIIDGFEVLDFDLKNAPTPEAGHKLWEEWKATVTYIKEDALDGLLVVGTRHNGFHVIYKTDADEPSKQLAVSASGKVLIETRGKGGLVFTMPTPGYTRMQGGWANLPAISSEHRALLIETARALNEVEQAETIPEQRKELPQTVRQGRTIFQAFNEGNDIHQLLNNYGWTRTGEQGGKTYYNRPNGGGKDPSANVKNDRLWIFSTSVTELPIGKSLSAFDLFLHYEHGGDMKSAVRSAYDQFPEFKDKGEIMANSPQLAAGMDTPYRFNIKDEIKDLEPFLSFNTEGHDRHYIPQSGFFTVTGQAGSYKTSLLRAIAASFLSGRQKAACKTARPAGKPMIWFDTELSRSQFQKNMSEIIAQAEGRDADSLIGYWLTNYTPQERTAWIGRLLEQHPDAGLVVVDGWRDLLTDFNDTKQVEELVRQIGKWRQQHPAATFAGVIHLNPGTHKMRGTLGTELLNKSDGVIQVALDEAGMAKVSFQRGRSWATPPSFELLMDADHHRLWHGSDPGRQYDPFVIAKPFDDFVPF